MTEILQKILSMVQTHGSLSMFIGGVVEQIIVPIPSPIITMSGGVFLVSRSLPILQLIWEILAKVSLPYSVGAIIGTSLVFLIAYFGGQPIIDKFGKYVGIRWSLIEKIRSDFQKTIKDELFIFISVIIPVVPVSLITGFCGGFRIKPQKFYPIMFLALIVRSFILAFIGMQMGEAFTGLANGLDKIESILTVVGAGLILGFLFIKREKWIKKNS
ncbi:MAG: VTT domain-containing protein [Candidatus Shapirobacteria bacterium]|jgi:membrane protein DedA with SNARE-associated domain|nr:VTT domain-containing protein [Candidatus Shapirobacteria bacterium]